MFRTSREDITMPSMAVAGRLTACSVGGMVVNRIKLSKFILVPDVSETIVNRETMMRTRKLR